MNVKSPIQGHNASLTNDCAFHMHRMTKPDPLLGIKFDNGNYNTGFQGREIDENVKFSMAVFRPCGTVFIRSKGEEKVFDYAQLACLLSVIIGRLAACAR